jgi:hypothetical protein
MFAIGSFRICPTPAIRGSSGDRPGWGGLPTFASLVTNGCLRHSGHILDYKCQRCAHLPEGLAEAHFLENRKATVRKKKADRKALCRHSPYLCA